jgi:2-polyprenyl-6-methoxyphenol hydroxylase-like FAD-dependent oxidoreductase
VGHIVVCGGSVVGLSLAMMLAGDGHRVTVLERDGAPPPADPWNGWARPGVGQFHQPHNLLARSRLIFDQEFPGLVGRLEEAGCVWVDWVAVMPPLIRDRSPRPGDDRFRFVTGRRPVVEAVLAGAAAGTEGVEVRRGVAVAGLLATPAGGVPRVAGVRTAGGEEITADLVVDAMGRRSRLAEWLVAAGGSAPYAEAEDCGFVYHTRYFRGPELPAFLAPPVTEMGSISLLTLPGDNGTWSVTVWAAADDAELRGLRHPDRHAAVVRACPAHAHWLEGEPITGVLSTAGVVDRYRRMVVGGVPVATGIVAVGDAWACTNPSAGRGMTVGLMHAQCGRDVVRAHLGDPGALAQAMDAATEAQVTPYYRAQITADRTRFAAMAALRRGEEPASADPRAALVAGAAMRDPDVYRAMLEVAMCLALPEEVLARPDLMARVDAVGRRRVWKVPGPDRQRLLELVGSSFGPAPPDAPTG